MKSPKSNPRDTPSQTHILTLNPTVQPNGNVIVDTICRTAKLGTTITGATENGLFIIGGVVGV